MNRDGVARRDWLRADRASIPSCSTDAHGNCGLRGQISSGDEAVKRETLWTFLEARCWKLKAGRISGDQRGGN
jgi:hypothetical protein